MKTYLFKYKKRISIIVLMLFLGGLINHFSTYNILQAQDTFLSQDSPTNHTDKFDQNVNLENIESEKVKSAFRSVWQKYARLQDLKIKLVEQEISESTMQAQPIITLRSLFSEEKRFRINVCSHIRGAKDLKVSNLSNEVLEGWFAHELGHIMDYKQYNNAEMVWYGLKYYFSSAAKKSVEYDADYIAIANGFQDEIMAMKKFILENDGITNAYKNKIKAFYLPEEKVMICAKDKDLLKPYLNL